MTTILFLECLTTQLKQNKMDNPLRFNRIGSIRVEVTSTSKINFTY